MGSPGQFSTNHDQSDYRSELHIPDYRSVGYNRCRSVIWIIMVMKGWNKTYHILTRDNFAPNLQHLIYYSKYLWRAGLCSPNVLPSKEASMEYPNSPVKSFLWNMENWMNRKEKSIARFFNISQFLLADDLICVEIYICNMYINKKFKNNYFHARRHFKV